MRKHNVMLSPLVLLSVILLSLTILNGCDMNDPMIKEMEAAYVAVPIKNEDTLYEKTEKRKEAVSRVVQKYLPEGMKAEDALRQLKKQGFEIRENRLDGARDWPDGELIPYRDETTKQNRLKIDPKGLMLNYTAKKDYGTVITLLAVKHVSISFRVVDGSGVISEVTSSIGSSGI